MKTFGDKFDRFVELVEELRSEKGCPWDREQTPVSLKRYLLEETNEAVEAINSDNPLHIKDELGDILYLLVLIAQIYSEKELFHIGDVVEAITDKMTRRHPHVFGDEKIETVAELRVKWREIKKNEKPSDGFSKKN